MGSNQTDYKQRKKKPVSIYMKNMLVKQIHLPISSLGNNINSILEAIISKQIAGKCIPEGYVKPGSIKILTYSNGNIIGNTIVFKVIFECLVCCPVEGMHINAVVKNVTKAGVRAEILDENSPLVIFIARDHHYKMPYFSSLKVNDSIKVRVIGQRFELEDTYISIIAELIEPYTEKVKRPKILLPEDEEDDEAINKEDEKKYKSTKRIDKSKPKTDYKETKQSTLKSRGQLVLKQFDEIVLNYNISDVKNKIDYSLFSISESSKYSSLMPWHLKQVEEFYDGLFKENIKNIIDATANIGVDTVFFSKLYKDATITSVELMPDEFENLEKNIIAFGLQDRVVTLNYNFLDYIDNGYEWWKEDYKVGNFIKLDDDRIEDIKNTFIYIDAPWGGPDYYKQKNLKLELKTTSGFPVEIMELSDYLFKSYKTKYIIVKVPRNYDFGGFMTHFNVIKVGEIMRGNNISFILVAFEYINDIEEMKRIQELRNKGEYQDVLQKYY